MTTSSASGNSRKLFPLFMGIDIIGPASAVEGHLLFLRSYKEPCALMSKIQ